MGRCWVENQWLHHLDLVQGIFTFLILNRRTSCSTTSKRLNSNLKLLESKKSQDAAVARILQFLTDRIYDQQISFQLLSRPTGAQYINILRFILKQLDPNLTFSEKSNKDIIGILKFLKYYFFCYNFI